MNRQLRSLSALVALVVLAWSAPAAACSCVVQPLAEAYAAADLVVEVRVTSVSSGSNARVELEVLNTFKGTAVTSIAFEISTHRMCPPEFVQGRHQILYLGGTPANPIVRDCSRVAIGNDIPAERRALRRLQRP